VRKNHKKKLGIVNFFGEKKRKDDKAESGAAAREKKGGGRVRGGAAGHRNIKTDVWPAGERKEGTKSSGLTYKGGVTDKHRKKEKKKNHQGKDRAGASAA